MNHRLAIASVAAARPLDEDLAPLLAALGAAGIATQVHDWDDPDVDWAGFDAVLLRSTWDYHQRLPEFLHWCEHVSAGTRLLNPPEVVRWNADKHYLAELAQRGVAVVESHFIEPGEAADGFPDFAEFVVKPCVSAGSRDTRRHLRAQRSEAVAHAGQLLGAGRSVLVQPYLEAVDTAGETALLFFAGDYSHAIRKGPLLRRDAGATELLFATEQIEPREASVEPDSVPPPHNSLPSSIPGFASLPEAVCDT